MAVIEIPINNNKEEKMARIAEIVAANEIADIKDSFSVLHENAQISYLLNNYSNDLKKFEQEILDKIKTDFYNSNGKLKKEKALEMYNVYATRFGQDIEELYEEIVSSHE